jgi:hypothetical protein
MYRFWPIAAALCLGCPTVDSVEDPAGEPSFESSDAVVLGDAVACEEPVEGFDRLEPIATELGVDVTFQGPLVYRLGQSGTVVRDLDGDGDLDVSLGGFMGSIWLFENDGQGGLIERDRLPKIAWRVMRHAAVDLTGDGLPELVFVGGSHLTWRENLGDLTWGPPVVGWRGEVGHIASALSFGDADGDGDLDVAIPGLFAEGPTQRSQDRIFRNDGADGFTLMHASPEDGDKPMSVVALWTDRDADGDQDLFLASHRAFQATPPNRFFRNDGPADGWATLTDDADAVGWAQVSSPMGIDSADLNHDGVLDYCFTDTGAIRCYLSGDGTWAEAGAQLGMLPPGDLPGDWSGWSIDLADLDVDGVIDGAVVAAFADVMNPNATDQPDALYRGVDGGFEERGAEVGFDDPSGRYGLVAADLFGDGHPEVITAGFDGAEVWNNPCGSGAWLDLRMVGAEANVDAFGARVVARAGDVTVTRELHNSRGPNQGPARFHLTFGDADVIDELTLTWPDGHVTSMTRVPVRRALTVLHPLAPEVATERI